MRAKMEVSDLDSGQIDRYHEFRPHPWHGLVSGPNPPSVVQAYIEITTYDVVKYEIDKDTGYLCVDRPQRTSSQPPTLYGFIPRTYCGDKVGALYEKGMHGDGDPLDICVVSERPIDRSEIVLTAHVVGGLQTIDNGKVDDKIIAILQNDNFWGDIIDISALPKRLIERLQHYFSTYKMIPGKETSVFVKKVYGRQHAYKVIKAAIEDYDEKYAYVMKKKK